MKNGQPLVIRDLNQGFQSAFEPPVARHYLERPIPDFRRGRQQKVTQVFHGIRITVDEEFSTLDTFWHARANACGPGWGSAILVIPTPLRNPNIRRELFAPLRPLFRRRNIDSVSPALKPTALSDLHTD